VNELIPANHNADVGCELPHAVMNCVEEDQIAGAEIAWIDIGPRLKLFGDGARQPHAMLIEHVPDEPAAVETSRVAAAIAVGHATKR
jgi:hypothetical protein